VIVAGEAPCVAGLREADLIAAVRAGIEKHVHLALTVAADDHGVLAHVSGEEVAGVSHLAFVRDEQPGSREDAL
jgi:hypothetical protein